MKSLCKSIIAACATVAMTHTGHAQPRPGNWYQQAQHYNYGSAYQAPQYARYQYPTAQTQQQQQQGYQAQQRQARPQQQQRQAPSYQPPSARDNTSQWMSDFDAAWARAQKQGRPLVALFVHHGCPECDRMDAILAQPGAMQNFDSAVKARIEFTQNPDVVNRFGLKFTPTLLVFSPGGNGEVYREVGAISADRLRLLKPSVDSLVTGLPLETETRGASKKSRDSKETSQTDKDNSANPDVAAL